LDAWLKAFAKAKKLTDVGITPPEEAGGGQERTMHDPNNYIASRAKASPRRETSAGARREEGARDPEARPLRRWLLKLVCLVRFGKLPEGIEKRIEADDDVEQLDAWLTASTTAATLADVPGAFGGAGVGLAEVPDGPPFSTKRLPVDTAPPGVTLNLYLRLVMCQRAVNGDRRRGCFRASQ
jgi:hypothetical protein